MRGGSLSFHQVFNFHDFAKEESARLCGIERRRRRAKALILFGKKLVLAFSVIAQENLSISPLGLTKVGSRETVVHSTNTQKLLMKHFMLESHLSHFSVVSNTKDEVLLP